MPQLLMAPGSPGLRAREHQAPESRDEDENGCDTPALPLAGYTTMAKTLPSLDLILSSRKIEKSILWLLTSEQCEDARTWKNGAPEMGQVRGRGREDGRTGKASGLDPGWKRGWHWINGVVFVYSPISSPGATFPPGWTHPSHCAIWKAPQTLPLNPLNWLESLFVKQNKTKWLKSSPSGLSIKRFIKDIGRTEKIDSGLSF